MATNPDLSGVPLEALIAELARRRQVDIDKQYAGLAPPRGHTCHATHCRSYCPPAMLMCRRCWRQVSPPHQAAVSTAHSLLRGRRPNHRDAGYLAAVCDARADVMKANGLDETRMRAAAVKHRERIVAGA